MAVLWALQARCDLGMGNKGRRRLHRLARRFRQGSLNDETRRLKAT